MRTGRCRAGKIPPLKIKRSSIAVVGVGGSGVVGGWTPDSAARARSSCMLCVVVWGGVVGQMQSSRYSQQLFDLVPLYT